MNEMMNLQSLLDHVTGNKPIDYATERAQQKKAARDIIEDAFRDGMEYLAEGGECLADLFQTWPGYQKSECLTETNQDAIFKSIDAALRNATEANLIALGRLVRDEAAGYIARGHESDVEDVQEQWNDDLERSAEDRVCAAEAAWEARRDDALIASLESKA